jgi:hypothetical protein
MQTDFVAVAATSVPEGLSPTRIFYVADKKRFEQLTAWEVFFWPTWGWEKIAERVEILTSRSINKSANRLDFLNTSAGI